MKKLKYNQQYDDEKNDAIKEAFYNDFSFK